MDLDEVIFDFVGVCMPRLNDRMGMNATREDFTEYLWMKTVFGLPSPDMFDFIIQQKLFEQAEPIKGSLAAVRKISKSGDHISLITSRGFHPEAWGVTEASLARHDVPYDRLIIVESGVPKSSYFNEPVDFFVDDHFDNHVSMIDAGMSKHNILIDNPWNSKRPGTQAYESSIERMNSLAELVNREVRPKYSDLTP